MGICINHPKDICLHYMIKNLIFDFGKVLVDYDFESILRTFFDDPRELMEFVQVVCAPEFLDRCDKEEIPFEDIIRETKEQYPQWASQIQTFHDRFLDFVIGEMPGMRELLLKLRGEGYKLYGLTNWCSVVHKVIEKYDILQLLDDRIISSEEHLIKPERAIYERLCEKFGVKAEECLFADDKEVNVEGAKVAGMHAVVFTTAEQYEKDLREIVLRENT